MLIRVRNIPDEGLDVDFSIPAKTLRSSFSKGDKTAEFFGEDVQCSVHLDENKKDVFLQGDIETAIKPICSRCGEEYSSPYTVQLNLTCSPATPDLKKNSYEESDEGLVFYNHDELDLSEIVREQILLSLPIQYICQPDCLGLCPECGANLNQGEHACPKRVTKH